MSNIRKRRVFEAGHKRKFLVVADETPEFRAAIFFAARVASRTGGALVVLNVKSRTGMSSWMPVNVELSQDVKTLAVEGIQQLRAWLREKGIEDLRIQSISRTGNIAEEIVKVIDEDEDIAVLVLGASARQQGPGPIISSLTPGSQAGDFPIPIYLVPGNLSFEEISSLA
ncbi:MAG: universal stress protein [Methyloligellaceae bacterium]